MAVTPAEIDALAVAHVEGRSINAAAKHIGMNASKAKRIAKLPTFKLLVVELRREFVQTAIDRYSVLLGNAALTVGELLKDKYDPEIRLKATRAIVADLCTLTQSTELLARIAELKALLESRTGS